MSLKFDDMRFQHETRMEQLEQEILECCRLLKKAKKQRQPESNKEPFIDYVATETYILWHFDMSEFQVENIKLELEQRCIKLQAHRKKQGQFLEVYRKFELPDNAEIDLSAKMGVDGILTIQAPLKTAP